MIDILFFESKWANFKFVNVPEESNNITKNINKFIQKSNI